MNAEQGNKRQVKRLIGVSALVAVAIIGFGTYRYWVLVQSLHKLQAETTLRATEWQGRLAALTDTNTDLQKKLDALTADNLQLSGDLEDKTKEVDDFDDRIAVVTKGIDTIQDTINTDPELLRKYSRVYFLSENYVPTSLSQIDTANTYQGEADSIHSKVKPFLDKMLAAAKEDDIDLLITSAYRSFSAQKNLNDSYSVIYGAGTANQFSAEQGYSEHQLGTTVDFVTSENDYALTDSFDATKAFAWLEDHAYRYGFVLSYPEGNSYYEYEPWHWRFVGEDLADDLHDADAYFYDWDQRQIDTYRAGFWKD